MADIELRDFSGDWKVPDNDRGREITSRARNFIIIWLGVAVLSFGARYCLFPFEDYLYLTPAMTYTTILALSSALYLLRSIIQLMNRRRYVADVSPQSGMTLRNLPRIGIVAALIILERIIYRNTCSFALGLELILLKAALPFTYLLFSLRRTSGLAAFSLPIVGVVATLFALFGATSVSPLAFITGIFINVLFVGIILRVGSILADMTIFSFLFQVSFILTPAFWLLVRIMDDGDWLYFYHHGAILQYMLGNGIVTAIQFILGAILIRDTLPNHHMSVFALGSIVTDLLARHSLRQSIFSLTSFGLVVAGTCCIITLFRTFNTGKRTSSAPKLVIFGIGIAFVLHIIIFGVYFLAQDRQPIITLIDKASLKFHDYTTAAGSSTLQAAVNEYKHRYGRPPPPEFDIWFQFAKDRECQVIHEYDQIVDDLRPFWGIEPKVLRERVAHVAGNSWNNFAQITIRDKKAEIGVSSKSTWMPEQMIQMIDKFIEWLPDMDILFNEIDECRVVIPWADKNELLWKEEQLRVHPKQEEYLSGYPEIKWLGSQATDDTDFEDLSAEPVWDFTTLGCPPSSPAHTLILSGSHLQSISMSPHTIASALRSTRYISSYPRAADICSRPDLRFESGFLMAPATFKGTHLPIPIFSQSRIEPYNDILMPSPMYNSSKVLYQDEKDLLWTEKYDSFFWRGASTNGISINGGWRFHLRERFIRIAQKLRGNIDVGFTSIEKCQDPDCGDETKAFELKPSVEFEEFFKYKFLPDMDGSAFSSRWIPFLKSRGLPFKLAIFREWFDSRLIAWRHFVPLDVRLRERDFRTVVNWFMKVENTLWAKKVADWGREWALETLRDEDAEVYLFRLLLEYARVMNDDRDRLGFELSDDA